MPQPPTLATRWCLDLWSRNRLKRTVSIAEVARLIGRQAPPQQDRSASWPRSEEKLEASGNQLDSHQKRW